MLIAMLLHPLGRHDELEELDYEMIDGVFVVIGIERYCWLCRGRDLST